MHARAIGRRCAGLGDTDRMTCWTGVLFAVGSVCFAVASFASQWASASRPAIGVTFFVGSIGFTSAAYLQLRAARPGRGAATGWRRSSSSPGRCSST